MKYFVLFTLVLMAVTVTSCGENGNGEKKNFTLQGEG